MVYLQPLGWTIGSRAPTIVVGQINDGLLAVLVVGANCRLVELGGWSIASRSGASRGTRPLSARQRLGDHGKDMVGIRDLDIRTSLRWSGIRFMFFAVSFLARLS